MKYIKYYENIDWKEDWEEEDPDMWLPIMDDITLPVGTKVKINPSSKYNDQGSNTVGEIFSLVTGLRSFRYYVKWDKYSYYYNNEDLLIKNKEI